MDYIKFKTNEELVNKVISLRKLGLSLGGIWCYLQESGITSISRNNIRDLLHELGYIKSYKHGGYRFSSGRGTAYLIDDIVLDSFGELVFYVYQKYINGVIPIKVVEPIKVGNYEYTPDFILNNKYYEIKSIDTDDFLGWNVRKLKGILNELVVVTREELLGYKSKISYVLTDQFISDHNLSNIRAKLFSSMGS